MNRIKQLEQFGQAVWLDLLSREFLASDDFRKMITEDGIKGMTSNPSIFEKAFAHGSDYDADIAKLVEQDVDGVVRQMLHGVTPISLSEAGRTPAKFLRDVL